MDDMQRRSTEERVARAIDPSAWAWLDTTPAHHPAFPITRDRSLSQARAAIGTVALCRRQHMGTAVMAAARAVARMAASHTRAPTAHQIVR